MIAPVVVATRDPVALAATARVHVYVSAGVRVAVVVVAVGDAVDVREVGG